MQHEHGEVLRLAVLISGSGRTLENLADHCHRGLIPAQIDLVISTGQSEVGIERSRRLGLRTEIIRPDRAQPGRFHEALTEAVRRVRADLVCMAGFLSLWPIPEDYAWRVINIHPALLPDFGGPGMYGNRVHAAVLAAGCRESGCTVHYCNDRYDEGPVILQRRVVVPPACTVDELAALVFEEEKIAYPEAIRSIARTWGTM